MSESRSREAQKENRDRTLIDVTIRELKEEREELEGRIEKINSDLEILEEQRENDPEERLYDMIELVREVQEEQEGQIEEIRSRLKHVEENSRNISQLKTTVNAKLDPNYDILNKMSKDHEARLEKLEGFHENSN